MPSREETPGPSALAEAIYRGDAAAETVLVERYGPALTYILERETHDEALAKDLYQESFLIVIERLRTRRLEQPEKLASFLQGVARNLLKAHRRSASRVETGSEAIDNAMATTASPFDELARQERMDALWKAVGRLPKATDRDLLRRYLRDQDRAAIRRALEITAQQLNGALYRARERLRQILASSEDLDRLDTKRLREKGEKKAQRKADSDAGAQE